MRVVFFLFILCSLLFSKVYYAKVEPYEIRNISSNVSGLVVFADENMLGKKLTSKAYIQIDSELDKKELQAVKDKIKYVKNRLKASEKILINLEKSLLRKRDNYSRIKGLKFKSNVEKDKEFYALISSENLYLSTQKEIDSLRIQLADLKLRAAQLRKSISDKYVSNKGFILYDIKVKEGQVVNIATPLAQVADLSRAKLTIYLDDDDVLGVEKKVVYINGKKTIYKVSRIQHIADAKNISKYKAQIITKAPKLFSRLVSVELKER